ncbi:MAG: hypothetical protein ABH879_03270 [archaeon]
MHKAGYFYTIDAFVAISIIIAGAILMYSSNVEESYEAPAAFVSKDLTNFLSGAQLYEINNKYIDILRADGNITNIRHTVFEQVGEYYYRYSQGSCDSCMKLAGLLLRNLTYRRVSEVFSYEIGIEGFRVLNDTKISQDDARVLIASKKLVFGEVNSTVLWGPYEVDLRVWQ